MMHSPESEARVIVGRSEISGWARRKRAGHTLSISYIEGFLVDRLSQQSEKGQGDEHE